MSIAIFVNWDVINFSLSDDCENMNLLVSESQSPFLVSDLILNVILIVTLK